MFQTLPALESTADIPVGAAKVGVAGKDFCLDPDGVPVMGSAGETAAGLDAARYLGPHALATFASVCVAFTTFWDTKAGKSAA